MHSDIYTASLSCSFSSGSFFVGSPNIIFGYFPSLSPVLGRTSRQTALLRICSVSHTVCVPAEQPMLVLAILTIAIFPAHLSSLGYGFRGVRPCVQRVCNSSVHYLFMTPSSPDFSASAPSQLLSRVVPQFWR